MRFSLTPARFDDPAATQEERATTGRLEIQAGGLVLTEGVAYGQDSLLPGPLISAYPLAEWLVWNRWRLLWEPRPAAPSREWAFAHQLSSVGSGYLWPNIELASDGHRVRLTSAPPADPCPSAFRYVGAPRSVAIAATELETAINAFAQQVLDELRRSRISESNLHVLCEEAERAREDGMSLVRRIEAALGDDPGEGDEAAIKNRVADILVLGKAAVMELAAGGAPSGASKLRSCLDHAGFDAAPADAIELRHSTSLDGWGATPAWMLGVALAQEARETVGLQGEPLTNAVFCDLAGIQPRSLERHERGTEEVSFEWRDDSRARIALRSKWTTGRRFDLARLLVDRWLPDGKLEAVLPATRAYTYRQKVQRAFAAEFLAPIDAVDAFLDGDVADARQEDAAQHFEVSPLAIRAILVNNDRIGRHALELPARA